MITKSFWNKRSIVIRTRTWYETCDLALRVAISQWKPLTLYFIILAVPLLAVDYAIWFGLFRDDFLLRKHGVDGLTALMVNRLDSSSKSGLISNVVFLEYLVILFQTPFMGSLMTQYLGKRLFFSERQIGFKEVWKDWRERLWQSFLFLIILRPFTFFFFNVAEIIQLERLPIFRGKSEGITLMRRMRLVAKSAQSRSGFFSRINFEMFNLSAVLSAATILWSLTSLAIIEFHWLLPITLYIYLPVILFGAAYFTVVYKFFYYINLRVNAEGWDVNLAMQVEGEKASLDLAKSQGSGLAGARGTARTFLPLEIIETAATQLNEQLGEEDTP